MMKTIKIYKFFNIIAYIFLSSDLKFICFFLQNNKNKTEEQNEVNPKKCNGRMI